MQNNHKTYKDLNVWQKSRKLVNYIYELTKKFPKDELYGLISQMRRCAVSIPSNIAEGSGRHRYKDAIHFFYIAKGSLYELETQLYLSFDQNFIKFEELEISVSEISECRKMISGLINYYTKEYERKKS